MALSIGRASLSVTRKPTVESVQPCLPAQPLARLDSDLRKYSRPMSKVAPLVIAPFPRKIAIFAILPTLCSFIEGSHKKDSSWPGMRSRAYRLFRKGRTRITASGSGYSRRLLPQPRRDHIQRGIETAGRKGIKMARYYGVDYEPGIRRGRYEGARGFFQRAGDEMRS